MPLPDAVKPLPLPDGAMWASLGVVGCRELHGGHQSRVFAAERNGDRVVVKLTDGRLVDHAYRRRVDVTALLAEIDDSVVGPIRTNRGHVAELGGWLAVVSPFVVGRTPDVGDEVDVRLMASTLADLHRSIDRLGAADLPAVAALAGADLPADDDGFGRRQLLHGDFSDANLLFSDGQVRVFDFDDCGYGPIEFEVGNTLYMVLFDAAMSSDMERYDRFRGWFVDEYRSASGSDVPDVVVERAIGLRVQALGRWLDHPESAPIGIRSATPAWRDSLRAFVQSRASR